MTTSLEEIYYKMYPNFKPSEFECPCDRPECRKHGMEYYFLAAIQDLRLSVGRPFKITSGYRCPEHNIEVGGVKGSWHLKGLACDISTVSFQVNEKHRFLKKALQRFNGVGIYEKFVHLDLRSVRHKALWVG